MNSGIWAQKAIEDAQRYGRARIIRDEQNSLPDPSDIKPEPDSDYLHITSNETINGIQWKDFPRTSLPLVADMSSDIFSRPLPVEHFWSDLRRSTKKHRAGRGNSRYYSQGSA